MPSPTEVLDQTTLNASTKNVKGSVQRGSDGRIYFRSSHELTGKNSLYSCAADGTGVTKLTAAAVLSSMNVASDLTAFRMSRDGGSIAFTTNVGGNGLEQLYTMKLTDAAASQRSAFTQPMVGEYAGIFGAGVNPLAWSPDGSKVAVVGDWALIDGDNSAFVLSATGTTSTTRILVPPTSMNQDVDGVWFSSDGQRLLVLGDLVINNDTELYAITNLTAADQTPTTVRVVTASGGDVDGAFAH
jgi:WD40 repeat protein